MSAVPDIIRRATLTAKIELSKVDKTVIISVPWVINNSHEKASGVCVIDVRAMGFLSVQDLLSTAGGQVILNDAVLKKVSQSR